MLVAENIHRDSRGLTLAELLVTVAIIALVAAITVPFYQIVTMNLDLSAASRDLASDLRYAQQLSVTTQVNYQVIFSVTGESYYIRNTSSTATVKSRKIKPPITILAVTDLPNNTVTFNSIGAATSTGTVTLGNPTGRSTTIIIEPSGYVEIQ